MRVLPFRVLLVHVLLVRVLQVRVLLVHVLQVQSSPVQSTEYSTLQIWGCVNQPFILFVHYIWGETALFIIQTSDRIRYFTILQDKLHSVNVQDDQWF